MGSARATKQVHIISPRDILKTKPGHVSRREKKIKSRKRARADHPAVIELTETLVKYKSQVIATQRTAITSTYFDLVEQLAKASCLCEQQADEQRAIYNTITAPFEDEVLEFRTSSADDGDGADEGVCVVKARLGERVAQFEHRTEEALSLLNELWVQWQDCGAEVAAAANELRAALEAEEDMNESIVSTGDKLREGLAEKCRMHVEACTAGETEFDVKKSQARKTLLKLLKAQVA